MNNLPEQLGEAKDRPVGILLYLMAVAHLFREWTRSALLKVYGYVPEPFDQGFGWQKRWWDTAAEKLAPLGEYRYEYIAHVSGGLPQLREMIITNAMAARANIPGKYPYPVYEIASTGAYMTGPTGYSGAMSGARLALYNQASVIAEALGALTSKKFDITETKSVGVFQYIFPADEQRRVWFLNSEGHQFNVGRLLSRMYHNGVDAPGHWEWKDRVGQPDDVFGEPVWVTDTEEEEDVAGIPVLPVPVKLLADETFVRPSPASPGMIKRADPDRLDPTDPHGSIFRLVLKIARLLGVS